jgi:hypothetical protein
MRTSSETTASPSLVHRPSASSSKRRTAVPAGGAAATSTASSRTRSSTRSTATARSSSPLALRVVRPHLPRGDALRKAGRRMRRRRRAGTRAARARRVSLVPPENADALSAAIIRLLEDPELRRRLGESGGSSHSACSRRDGWPRRRPRFYRDVVAAAAGSVRSGLVRLVEDVVDSAMRVVRPFPAPGRSCATATASRTTSARAREQCSADATRAPSRGRVSVHATPWSGVVRLEGDGRREYCDLYAPENGDQITWRVALPPGRTPGGHLHAGPRGRHEPARGRMRDVARARGGGRRRGVAA